MPLSPEREAYYAERRQRILEKNPSLSRHRIMQSLDFITWTAMRQLHIDFACAVWPFAGDPRRIDKHSRKYASEGLIHASAVGDIKAATQWLDMGADINYQDENGRFPLLIAIRRKRLGMAEFLLQQGANPEQKNKYGWFPALESVYVGLPLAFPILKRYGADLDKSFHITRYIFSFIPVKCEKYYPLSFACLSCLTVEDEKKKAIAKSVVKSLLKSGVNPNITYENKPLVEWVSHQRKLKQRFWLKGTLQKAIKERNG